MKLDFKQFRYLVRSKGILGRNMILEDAVKEYLEMKKASTRADA